LKISDYGHFNTRWRSKLWRSNLNVAVAPKHLREQLAVDESGALNLKCEHLQQHPGLVFFEQSFHHADIHSTALHHDATLGLEHVEYLKSSYVRFHNACLNETLGDRQDHMKVEALNGLLGLRYFQSELGLLLQPHHQHFGQDVCKGLHLKRHRTNLELATFSILDVKTPANTLRLPRVGDQLEE